MGMGFAFGFNPEADVKIRALQILPSRDEALRLIDIFFDFAVSGTLLLSLDAMADFLRFLVAWVRYLLGSTHLGSTNSIHSPTLLGRKEVMEELFHPAYDGDLSALSSFSISSLLSIFALGILLDPTTEAFEHDFRQRRYWARALFWTEFPKGPTTIAEVESLLLLVATSPMLPDMAPEQAYELNAWGMKVCQRVSTSSLQLRIPLLTVAFHP
jgi:hypothetical protein